MKRLFNTTIVLCIILSLLIISSCTTTKKVVVTGVPGTTIHKYRYSKEIGTIGADGQTKVKLDASRGFYLSKAPNSPNYIPFAVNVKDNWHADEASYGVWSGAMILSGITFFLAAPLLFQPDKPLDTSTNNLLIPSKSALRSKTAIQDSTTNVKFHLVVKSDTIESIANTHGVSIEQICSLNNINPTDQLTLGILIRIR